MRVYYLRKGENKFGVKYEIWKFSRSLFLGERYQFVQYSHSFHSIVDYLKGSLKQGDIINIEELNATERIGLENLVDKYKIKIEENEKT